MKKRLAVLFIISLCLLLTPLYSIQYSPKTINVHSPLYEETDLLYRLHGLALPSGARPWSTEEAALILSAIPDGGRTQELKEQALSRLETTLLKQDSNGLSHRFSTTVALEAYTHTNTSSFVLPQDWAYNKDRRLPLFDFRMELQWGNTFYFATSVEMGPSAVTGQDIENVIVGKEKDKDGNIKNIGEYENTGIGAIVPSADKLPLGTSVTSQKIARLFQKIFNTNIMTFDKNFEDIWPKDSQITLGGAWWNLSLGRGPVSWGVGQSGNLILGDHIDSHNNLNISFFSEEFKLQFLYLFLPNPLQREEEKIFMGHRLETQPLPWLRLAISENVMFYGKNFHLGYIDPTYIYHNIYYAKDFNALAGLELQISLAPGFSFYTQFALDQYQFSNESGSEANAMGLLVGMTHSTLLQKGILSTTLEVVGTDPSLYRRNNVDFLMVRGLASNGNPVIFDYLGYKWGSDSIAVSAEMVYLIPGKARYSLNALIHRQGEVTIYGTHSKSDDNTDNSDIKGPPPYGKDMSDQIIIGLEGSWWLKDTPIRFFSEFTWIGRRSYDTTTKISSSKRGDFQLVGGMVYTF